MRQYRYFLMKVPFKAHPFFYTQAAICSVMGLRQRCSLSLLVIIELHFLINAIPGSCQQTHIQSVSGSGSQETTFLLTASSNDRGTEIKVFSSGNHAQDYSQLFTNLIPDRSLPPECGAHYFRCQDLLVETVLPQDGGEINVLLIPLERGMAIITSPLNDLTWKWHTFVVDSPDCSPTVIYKAGESLFTVCINFTLQHIAVYKIQLHWNEKQIIDGAVFEGPLAQLSITNLSTSNLSNFVFEVSSQVHKVYFAVDNAIFVMDVLEPTQTRKYPDLPRCRQIHKLTFADRYSLLAYCSDRYIYFDTVYDDWTQIHLYSRYGIPYLCPNNNYKVAFFNNTEGDFFQFTKEGSMLNPIYNIDINSGICFEIENTTYFTWSDPQSNSIFVFDFVSGNHFPISPYECSSMNCPQLLILKNQYIVVRSDDNVFVIDAVNKFSMIVNVSQTTIPDILTLFYIASYNTDTTTAESPSTSSLTDTTTYDTPTTVFPSSSSSTTESYSTSTVALVHNYADVIVLCIVTVTCGTILIVVILITLLVMKRERRG